MSQRSLTIYALVVLLACIGSVSGLAASGSLSPDVLTFLSVVAGIHGGGVAATSLMSSETVTTTPVEPVSNVKVVSPPVVTPAAGGLGSTVPTQPIGKNE